MSASPTTTSAAGEVFCGDWLRTILARDGWTLDTPGDRSPLANAAFVARKERRRIALYFGDQDNCLLTKAFRTIARNDRNAFRTLGVLIVPTKADLQRVRAHTESARYPRALFTSAEDLRAVAAGRVPVEESHDGDVQSFHADLLGNLAIGEGGISHYLLKFRAPELDVVLPPQFIMMDTMPSPGRPATRVVRRGNLRGTLDLAQVPYVKRPFGVYRAYYRHFARDYLKRLALPPTLALALYPPCPDHYDMLYKVLPNGVGTHLMTHLKRGQKVHMLGPLGRAFDVRQLRAQGTEEVHVIGGGVGMAPLVLLMEALRYYSFRVKVFLGIAHLDSLRYRDELASTFGERPRDAIIYIDDLLAIGVKPGDLHVSFDTAAPKSEVRGIPKENLFAGFVTDMYRKYLERNPQRNGILAFTCGPNRMMELVCDIAAAAGVPLKLLMEKRMGCGIGVCFSCVASVRRENGEVEYARVCREGPLFDAKDILWKDESKPQSATSSCAARC